MKSWTVFVLGALVMAAMLWLTRDVRNLGYFLIGVIGGEVAGYWWNNL